MNASRKHDGSHKHEGFHKLAPDPDETPRGDDVAPDDERRSGKDAGDDTDATGPAHRASAEGGAVEGGGAE